MKKLVLILLMGTFILGGVSAKTWTSNAGFGLTVPISTLSVKDGDDINQTGFGLSGFYLGYHEKGFTIKAEETVAGVSSKDVADDDKIGAYGNFDIGAGYTFQLSEKFILSALGMLGIDFSVYTDDDSKNNTYSSYKETLVFASFNVGADLYAAYRLKDHFGLFANVGVRYLAGGASGYSIEYKIKGSDTTHTDSDSEGNLSGKFRVQPTIGVVWNF